MKCPSLEQLAEYQEELLTAGKREQIRHHLAVCAHCRQEMASLDHTMQLLTAVSPPEMPENLWNGVAARLPGTRHNTWGHTWWKTAASIGLAALLIGAGLLHQRGPVLTAASPSTVAFVTENKLYSAQDPLSDRASISATLISQRNSQP